MIDVVGHTKLKCASGPDVVLSILTSNMDIEQGIRSRFVGGRTGQSNDEDIIQRFTRWFNQTTLARCLRSHWVKRGVLCIIYLRLLYFVYDTVMIQGVDWSAVFSVNSILNFIKEIIYGVSKRLLRDIVIVGVIVLYIIADKTFVRR